MSGMNSEEQKALFVELRQLNEQLHEKVKAIEARTAKGGVPPEEFKAGVDAINNRISDIEAAMNRPTSSKSDDKEEKDAYTPEVKALAEKFYRRGVRYFTPEDRKQWEGFCAPLCNPGEMKVLAEGDDTTGGYLVVPQVVSDIIRMLTLISPMRELATVRPISSQQLIMPRQTGTFDISWTEEAATQSESTFTNAGGDFPVTTTPARGPLGQEVITAHECRVLVKLTNQQIEDSIVNVEGFVNDEAALRFAKGEGAAFISGNGVTRPMGFLSDARVGVSASGGIDYTPQVETATLTKSSPLVALIHSLPTIFAANATFVMNRKTLGVIRQMVDGMGRPLWQPMYALGMPNTILGEPYKEMPDMPDIGAGTYPVAYGDWKRAYVIADRVQMYAQRLIELYAANSEVGLAFRKRIGGKVVLPNAIVKLKIAAS
jgi:HK97 family phage major capsid protein